MAYAGLYVLSGAHLEFREQGRIPSIVTGSSLFISKEAHYLGCLRGTWNTPRETGDPWAGGGGA